MPSKSSQSPTNGRAFMPCPFVDPTTILLRRLYNWPCVLYIRTPMSGSALGKQFLREEKKMLVVPYGSFRPPLK
jgi:hypothetical protein